MIAAISQSNPRIGDFPANARKILEAIQLAKKAGAKLVVFPELATTGYPPRDLLDYESFIDENLAVLGKVREVTRSVTAIVGFVERNTDPVGKPFFNSAAVLQDGKTVAVYRKKLLPYYDVFDEERYFEPGPAEPCVFSLEGQRVAVTICEDIWNSARFLKRPYAVQPLELLKKEKPDLVVNLSASPFQLGKPALRVALFGEAASALKAPVLFCNQVGGNDELLFDGSSFAVAPGEKILARGKSFEEDLLVVSTMGSGGGTQARWPQEEGEWLFGALRMGIRDYVHKCGARKVCLGLSGGIDSSVVAALAVAALGKENVEVLSLPTRYTAEASEEDAALLAKRLGIRLHTVPIEPLFERHQEEWRKAFGKDLTGVCLENLQPRIRMTVLMAFANDTDRLLLNTSNKSEIATGYATLYGDASGALAVLGDLTKGQVYTLARYLNRGGEVIPKRVLERAPTAELRENQTDQDSLPSYDLLDRMVERAVVHGEDFRRMAASGIPSATARTFARLFSASEFKRRQLPPVLRVSPRAFGMGRRVPIASVKP